MLKGHESARVTGEDVLHGRNSIYRYKQENGRSSYFRRTQQNMSYWVMKW